MLNVVKVRVIAAGSSTFYYFEVKSGLEGFTKKFSVIFTNYFAWTKR
jgi:hypothetical protein